MSMTKLKTVAVLVIAVGILGAGGCAPEPPVRAERASGAPQEGLSQPAAPEAGNARADARQGDTPRPRNAPVARAGGIPIGWFGLPIGTYLTIEGKRVDGGRRGTNTLRVDTLNGKKLDEPIEIWVENVRGLPEDSRCVLKGYETGRMVGTPPAVREAAKETGSEVAEVQVGWHFHVYFIVTSAVPPTQVEIRGGQ